MPYDFDRIIDRRNSNSVKHELAAGGKAADLLPLWVADMDFAAPPCVIEALTERAAHGIYGYTASYEDYFAVLRDWFARRMGWQIEPEWLVKTPGVVTAIHIALCALTQPGDSILIQEPVYYPFAAAVHKTGRKLVVSELIEKDGHYSIDFADFEAQIVAQQVKLFILCNPHNPVGRVWTPEELSQLAEICLRHNVLVIADEIHQDFIYPGHRHQVFADLQPELREITVTCTAPSKTFNLAGLQASNIFIPNPALRQRFQDEYNRCGLSQPGLMGIVACQAAYAGGEAWLEELLRYLQGNMALIRDFCASRLPGVSFRPPEGTYLAWLDFRALGLDATALDQWIEAEAKLWLDGGAMFGPSGAGFQRVNAACPRAILQEALERIEKALPTRT